MPRRQLDTFGGTLTGTIWSGGTSGISVAGVPGGVLVAGDVLLQSGPGRFDGGFVHQSLLSGQPVFFYDSQIAASGGPIPASGHIILGVLNPAPSPNTLSGFGNVTQGGLITFGTAFFSGLCAHTISGNPGFTASWTPLP